MRPLIILSFMLMVMESCYYDHANLSYPQSVSTTGCIVAAVTYSATVTGILNANCYSCHSGTASAGGGIKLDTYASLSTYVSNGQLMNSINHTGGIAAMPLNAPQLSSCQIKTIQTWINNGSPNN
ncbi:MAG: hypothetical protein ACXVI9_04110 [Mucilaginibacter sp.]